MRISSKSSAGDSIIRIVMSSDRWTLSQSPDTPHRGVSRPPPNGEYQDHPQRGSSRNPSTGGTTKTQGYEYPRHLDAGNENSLDDDDYGRARRTQAEEVKNSNEITNGDKRPVPPSLSRLLTAVAAKRDDEFTDFSSKEADRWIEKLGLEGSARDSLAQVVSRIQETHGPNGISEVEETIQRCGNEYRAGVVSNIDAYLAQAVSACLSTVSLTEENAGHETDAQPPLSESETGKSGTPPAGEGGEAGDETTAVKAEFKTESKKKATDKRRKDKEFYEALDKEEPEVASCLPVLAEIEGWPTGPNEDRRTVEALRKYMEKFPDVDPKELCTLFADWHLDNPLKANSNPRARLRTWFQKDREFGGRASRNRPAPGQVPLNGRRKGEPPVYGVGNGNRKSFKEIMEGKNLMQNSRHNKANSEEETDG